MKKTIFGLSLLCITQNILGQQGVRTSGTQNDYTASQCISDSSVTPSAPLYPTLQNSDNHLADSNKLRKKISRIKKHKELLLKDMQITLVKAGVGIATFLAITSLWKYSGQYSDGELVVGRHVYDYYTNRSFIKIMATGLTGAALIKVLPRSINFMLYKQLSIRQQELEQEFAKDQKPTSEQLAMQARYEQLTQEAEHLKRQLTLPSTSTPKSRGASFCTIV